VDNDTRARRTLGFFLDASWWGSHAVRRVSLVALTSMFWVSGTLKLFDFAGTQVEMAHVGLHPAAWFAAATIAVQLGGSWLVVFTHRWRPLGAAVLGLFTLATIPLAHPFWRLAGEAAAMELAIALEHLSVVGALLLAGAPTPATGTLDERR
jgi:transmembrane protein